MPDWLPTAYLWGLVVTGPLSLMVVAICWVIFGGPDEGSQTNVRANRAPDRTTMLWVWGIALAATVLWFLIPVFWLVGVLLFFRVILAATPEPQPVGAGPACL